MPRATRNWSEARFKQGISAFESFTVDGVASEDAAIQATPYPFGAKHNRDFSLVVAVKPDVITLSPPKPDGFGGFLANGVYKVLIDFQLGGGITSAASVNQDVLARPMRWHPETMLTSEIVDHDYFNNPLRNSALDPLPDVQVDREELVFVGRRWEKEFSVKNWLDYKGAICSDALTIPKVGTFRPGEPCLIGYTATDEWDKDTTAVPVEYRIWVRPGVEVTIQNKFKIMDGHMKKFLDRGTQGYFKKNGALKKTEFYDDDSPPKAVAEPILLDGGGIPKESRYKLGSSLETPVSPDITFADNILDKSNKDAVYIRYCLRPIKPFAPLKLNT